MIFDTAIRIPVPDGYVDVSKKRDLPSNNAMFVTKEIEPWEKAGEISESILFYGLGLKSSKEAIKQQKFEEIVRFFSERIETQINGQSSEMKDALIGPDLIDSIYQVSLGKNARSIELTDDRKDRKALLIDTGLVMPGIVTYPMIEEISFTRLRDRIVIFHAIRVDTSNLENSRFANRNSRAQLKATGVEIRDGLIRASR